MENTEEIWRDVEGYPGYKISKMGNIMGKWGRPMKPQPSADEYLHVGLWCNSVRKDMSVSRLVAVAFLPNLENLPEVDHINKERQDNRVCNLRWATKGLNRHNQSKKPGTSSIYRGVRWDKRNMRWVAQYKKDYKSYHIGRFISEREAAIAYNNKIIEVYGADACLNIILPDERAHL